MFKLAKSKSAVVVLLFAILTLPAGMARADNTASSPTTATSSTSAPTIVSGTDPEPASPGIIQIILTILTAS